jgi:hypothetical protein
LKNLSKSQESNKDLLTEFERIARLSDADQVTIDEVELAADPASKWQKTRDLLEQKATSAIEPYVLAILQENKIGLDAQYQNIRQIESVLQKALSSLPAQATCYSRAGKAYLRVSHEMGDMGNLFLKSLFYNVLKDFGDDYHIQTQENAICAICRI